MLNTPFDRMPEMSSREVVQQQLAELELVEAMFCGPDEFVYHTTDSSYATSQGIPNDNAIGSVISFAVALQLQDCSPTQHLTTQFAICLGKVGVHSTSIGTADWLSREGWSLSELGISELLG